MKFKSNLSGVCPFCGNDSSLDYGYIELEGDMAYFPWVCSKCKNEGQEWYSMSFTGHNVDTELGIIEIEDNMIEEVI